MPRLGLPECGDPRAGVTTQSLFNPNYADLRLLDPGMDASRTTDLIGNVVFALIAVALLMGATIRRDKLSDS